jgi:hypothetical protein
MYNLGSAYEFGTSPSPPVITSQPGPAATVNLGGPATFNVSASSSTLPLSYQWRLNGQPISGATNATISIFPVPATNANYDVVITNQGGVVTSSVAPLTVRGPYVVSDWRMESQVVTPNSSGSPAFNGVFDSAIAAGQGVVAVGTVVPAAEDDLITFNGLLNGPVALSTNVPPASMFVNGHNGGTHSYNAEAITNVDGALFFPQDQYGDEFDFTSPFSIELFFKTDGDQQNAGIMQLVSQGTDSGQIFRYGISINESSAGAVTFKVANSSLDQTGMVNLSNTNYADGQWHYLLAVCDTSSGTSGQLRLSIVNLDGTESSITNSLPAGFLPLPATDIGNMFLGRYTYPVSQTPRTFRGLIDEVRITAGVVTDGNCIGRITSTDNQLLIKDVMAGTDNVSFGWIGATSNHFLVQWVSQLGNVWQTIATMPGDGEFNRFTDINPARLTSPMGFYRIRSE